VADCSTKKYPGWANVMSAFNNLLTPAQEARLRALDAWHRVLENKQLRMDCPDAYHDELVRQSDEMDRLGIVTWNEWRDLRMQADQAYLRAVAGADYQVGSNEKAARTDHAHR
jgi:hypothetical protein